MNSRTFVAALAAKPFVILTGNSGTGKTKLAELFAKWLCAGANDYCVTIPVGADWTDNRNVLGFVNHIRPIEMTVEDKKIVLPLYQSTRVLDLLLAAAADQSKPYFLILDEMNLSHVERYFADFLSAMESADGLLLLHREGTDVKLPCKIGGLCDVPETLALPRNVFVIGTVNVDETTYMFSPKVLDRANVLEFRLDKDSPSAFLESGGKPVADIEVAPPGYAEAFLELSRRARNLAGTVPLTLTADPANPPADAKEAFAKCKETIVDLFSLMQIRRQEFAFRSMSEILRFLAVDYELTPDADDWNWAAAMDAQIMQKILPKLHGSRKRIEPLLLDLARYCEAGKVPAEEGAYQSKFDSQTVTRVPIPQPAAAGEAAVQDPVSFRTSYEKLCDMIDAVRLDQFVSFIR